MLLLLKLFCLLERYKFRASHNYRQSSFSLFSKSRLFQRWKCLGKVDWKLFTFEETGHNHSEKGPLSVLTTTLRWIRVSIRYAIIEGDPNKLFCTLLSTTVIFVGKVWKSHWSTEEKKNLLYSTNLHHQEKMPCILNRNPNGNIKIDLNLNLNRQQGCFQPMTKASWTILVHKTKSVIDLTHICTVVDVALLLTFQVSGASPLIVSIDAMHWKYEFNKGKDPPFQQGKNHPSQGCRGNKCSLVLLWWQKQEGRTWSAETPLETIYNTISSCGSKQLLLFLIGTNEVESLIISCTQTVHWTKLKLERAAQTHGETP